jgi:hypothetical protein
VGGIWKNGHVWQEKLMEAGIILESEKKKKAL